MASSSKHVFDVFDEEKTSEAVQAHQSTIKDLVSAREIVTESFLKDIFDSLPDPPNSSAVELARAWKEEAKKKITNLSVTLSHRVQPIVNLLLEQKLSNSIDKQFVTVAAVEHDLLDMVNKYRKCFNIWVDAVRCVSFKATNTLLLGKVHAKDMYILTFFSFLTCKRSKFDNVLQLGMVGCSTAGKSTLFETCLMEGSHVSTNETGVGRYEVGNKPVLMFHDISIRTLAMGQDTEKIKTIARTEPTVTKIHGTIYTLPPLFLFYSSNERLMMHKFDGTPEKPQFAQFYHSQVDQVGKKRISDENLLAVQNRFIEAFVRQPPPLDINDLPLSGGFLRIHAILGLFKRVMGLLKKYQPSDFHSPMLVQYVLHGLCANGTLYAKLKQRDISETLHQLIQKFVEPHLRQPLLDML